MPAIFAAVKLLGGGKIGVEELEASLDDSLGGLSEGALEGLSEGALEDLFEEIGARQRSAILYKSKP